jgi:eukaryotic-like serine/threonine-protein kinase
MAKSTKHATTLTLRAPIANEEERALFQRRLALTAFVVFVLAFGFWTITFVSTLIIKPNYALHLFTHRPNQIQLGTTATAALIWLAIRRGKPTAHRLATLDILISVGLCIGWGLMIASNLPREQRPEMIALLACSYTLVCRAALIPSAPARTAALGLASLAPLVPITWWLYKDVDAADPMGLSPAIYCAIWAVLGVSATTVISYVIYGLRIQVRKAMQLGQYTLEEQIGQGGMGVVYRASHAMLRRPTAIKLLSGDAAQAAERFEREVQITARLTHPNTVAIFDYGRTPDGVFYYAMELLEGVSLEDLVTAHGPQHPRRVGHILLQMCGALEEAHAVGLVHRDIKPANVMLTERGRVPDVVKVLDFGLVKETVGGAGDPKQTSTNAIMGTPHYMAPEAIVDPEHIDGRADLYAVGATAYFLLTGENVFDGTNLVEVCSQHLHEKPTPPREKREDIPEDLEKVVLALLAKKKDDRPSDAATLAKMIRACNLGEWTREEAQAWWIEHGKKANGAQTKIVAKPKKSTEVSVFGNTIAVALDDRAAS